METIDRPNGPEAPPMPQRIEYLGEASTLIDSILAKVEQMPVFKNFADDEIKTLTDYMQCFGAAAGEEIIAEGRSGDYLVLLLSGEVHLLRSDAGDNGARKLVAVAGPGAILGEMSVVDGEARMSSCVTAKPTDFALLHKSNLNRLLTEVPDLGNRFLVLLLQLVTRHLRESCVRLGLYTPAGVA